MPTPEYTDMITPTLVINKLTKAQYETIPNPSDTELYLVPDDDLREHRSYYTTGTATVDGETVDVDIMYEGVAPEGSLETDAVWTITTIVATLDGNVLSNDVDTDQTWDYPTPTPVVPVIDTRPPICYPTTATNVGVSSMDLKSSVSDNGLKLTEVGFVYNISGDPTISDTKVVCDLCVGFFEKKLENLTQNTEYHIKSYGQNASGLVYGSELVRSTLNSPIPSTYQLVEYLESSGTQYINTGYMPDIAHTIIGKLSVNSGFSTANGIGCYDTNTAIKKRCFFGGMPNDEYLNIANSTSGYTGLQIQFDTQQHLYTLTPSSVSIDEYTAINVNEYPSEIFILFGYWTHTPTTSINYAHIKLSYFKVMYNNSYLKRMYPVYRKADNKPGMYDIVNGVFYTNQGTGEFIVGPDKEWDE